MKFETYPDRDALMMGVADRVASDLENALLHSDAVSLAVPGGTTPGPVFDIMSAVHLDWGRIHVMLTDERWVPEDHERSNAGLVKQRLLKGPAAAAQFVPFYTSGDPDQQVAARASDIAAHLPLSVVVLGMGADMHTASLFPGAPGLTQALASDAPALTIMRPENQPDMRVTLAAHALAGGLAKHLLITGAEKRAALERAQSLPVEQAPV
ncbi:MAG: 6-phosphogluconolactonase, partial [Paracoccaceae bacterium]